MASAGNQICYANFSSSSIDSYDSGERTGSGSLTLYISAPSIYIDMYATGALLVTAYLTATFYCYDWENSAWISAGSISGSAGVGETSWGYFYHNYTGHTHTFGDTYSKYCFWKIVFSWTCGSGGVSRSAIRATTYKIGKMDESTYNSYFQNKQIMSAGNSSGTRYHVLTSSETESDVIDMFRWSNDRGSPILATKEEMLVPKWWV